METAYQRIPGEQTTQGYRPLPGVGRSRGTDLNTTIYAGIGIAMGIVAGTLLAGGPWGRTNPNPSSQSAQVSVQVAGPAARPANQAASIPPAKPSEAAEGGAQTAGASLPQLAASALPQLASVQQPARAVTPVALTGTLLHKHRPVHRLVSGRRTLGRRHGHGRHRLHLPLKTTAGTEVAASAKPANAADTLGIFGFTVEGSQTVAGYDSPAATIQTYEGESFALDKAASDTTAVSWLEYPADIHYLCDQSGNCTLQRAGVVASNVRRTR